MVLFHDGLLPASTTGPLRYSRPTLGSASTSGEAERYDVTVAAYDFLGHLSHGRGIGSPRSGIIKNMSLRLGGDSLFMITSNVSS